MLERLNAINDVPICSVFSPVFAPYGRILTGIDFSPLARIMENETAIPDDGNVYVPSEPALENEGDFLQTLQNGVYGGMPVQIGYCNGRNTTYNGFEYHKGSEVNVAVTDFCLVLGHVWQIRSCTFTVGEEKVFYVPRGTAIEMYATTLHLSPCRVRDEGFRDIVILPRGTNTPLVNEKKAVCEEDRLLLQKNKWVISHPDREPLIRQGAFPGLIGENKEIRY